MHCAFDGARTRACIQRGPRRAREQAGDVDHARRHVGHRARARRRHVGRDRQPARAGVHLG
eukprot:5819881-Lingulodinium_polyedra.AAC.1